MSIIPRSKFGDCSKCGAKNTNVVKVKKDLFCFECNANAKRKQYVERATVRNSRTEDKISESDRSSLIHDLDFTFSRYIRIREANTNGIVECYTCGKSDHWTKMQCGHYIKRADTLLRWDSRNARTQCESCNCYKHGNIDEYTNRLNEEQPGLPEQLREESREVNKYGREELKQLLIDYRAKLKLVQTKFK
jgi:hypothetical protein